MQISIAIKLLKLSFKTSCILRNHGKASQPTSSSPLQLCCILLQTETVGHMDGREGKRSVCRTYIITAEMGIFGIKRLMGL